MKKLFQIACILFGLLITQTLSARGDREAIRQSFCRVGLLSAQVLQSEGISGSFLSADVLDDSRLVTPSGFLMSFQAGMSHRGWVRDYGSLQTSNLLGAIRPGWSIRFGEKVRLDAMAGVYVSYDLWGTQQDEYGYSIPLRRVDGFNRFEFGVNAGLSFVVWKFEIYTELRQGTTNIYKLSDFKETSFVWCFGVGWSF